MTSETHFLFNSVFTNTHSELTSLREQMEEFQIIYQSNETAIIPFTSDESPLIDVLIEPISIEPSLNDESNLNEPILNDEQINKFKKIYTKNKDSDTDKDDQDNFTQKLKNQLSKKDDEAQIKKLQTTVCCARKECLQNLVHHGNALITYQKFQNLNKNQRDMFLLGVISVTTRSEITTTGQKRCKLASEYVYEGINICNVAFLTIYGFGEAYWNNIRTHFVQEGINPRIHKAIGRISNSALSFEKVLEIISFITNYANIHGLPSPGNYLFFLFF
jgi:hypothetical protein